MNHWCFELSSIFYGDVILSSTTLAVIDTSQTFMLMPELDYRGFTSQVTQLDGFNCDVLKYCVSVTHPCIYYQPKLQTLKFYI